MEVSEDDLIARWFAPLAGPAGLGLHDDAGLVAVPPGQELVVTKDALVAGVHFFAQDPPASIAHKALGVNLSDLAAKAARPLGFLLAIALPPEWTTGWLDGFAEGLAGLAAHAGCPLIGGDTVSTRGPLVLSITALGLVAEGRMLRRTGARAGDHLYVSGTIGDGALGLQIRRAELEGGHAPWIDALAEDTTGSPCATATGIRNRASDCSRPWSTRAAAWTCPTDWSGMSQRCCAFRAFRAALRPPVCRCPRRRPPRWRSTRFSARPS